MRRHPEVCKGPSVQLAPASAPIVLAYIRVSSASQDAAYQRTAIEHAARCRGFRIDHWFADVATGGTMDRPELGALHRALERGGVHSVWVWRLDRLSRSGIAETFGCIDRIRRTGAALISVADAFALDDGPMGDLVLAVISWAAQQERLKIRENQAAARQRLEQQGRTWGRPPLAPHKRDGVRALQSQGRTRREIARALEISESSVRKLLREFGLTAAAENKPLRGE